MNERDPASERWFEKIERGFGQSLLQVEGGSSGAARYAFLGSTALILATAWILGPYSNTIFPSDTMFFLTQGDYLARGYRPYVDYYSLHSFFPFLFSAIGIELQGISMRAVLLAQILGSATLGVLLHRVAASRVHPILALFLGLSAVLMLVSCTPIGYETWRAFSAAMWYNRVGFVLQAIVLVYAALPSRDPHTWSRCVDSLIASACIAALFHTKLTFFVPTLVVLIAGAILWPRSRDQRILGVATLVQGLILCAVALALLHGSLRGYFGLLRALPTKVGVLALACRYVQYTRTLSVFLIAMLALAMAASRAGLAGAIRREWLLAALMGGTLVLSVATASQNEEIIPFLGVVPLTAAVVLARLARREQVELNRPLAALAVILALSMLVHVPKDAALSWAFSRANIRTLGPGERLAGAGSSLGAGLPVSDRVDPSLLSSFPADYGKRIRAALTLLAEAGCKPGEVLFVATTADDVTLLTTMDYAKGGTPWWQLFLVEDPARYPLPNRDFLADTQWILRDKNDPVSFGHDVWRLIEGARGAYVRDHFQVATESVDWIVYRRVAARAGEN